MSILGKKDGSIAPRNIYSLKAMVASYSSDVDSDIGYSSNNDIERRVVAAARAKKGKPAKK